MPPRVREQPGPVSPLRVMALCLDAVDVERMAAFWSALLGLRVERRGELARLLGDEADHVVWVNPVPQAKAVKHRVHLDVHVAAVADVLALGATVLDDGQPWTVLADPEGGELCAFVRTPAQLPAYRLYEIVVDCADPCALGAWWAAAFGVELSEDPAEGYTWIEDVPGLGRELVFVPVSEPRQGPNRVHLDVVGRRAEVLAAGATLVRGRDEEIGWDVLADPEGNEFCVFDTDDEPA